MLNAAANYEKSKVNLDFTTSETLTKLGIDIGDAEAGKVKQLPTVNGVVPANVQNILGAPRERTSSPRRRKLLRRRRQRRRINLLPRRTRAQRPLRKPTRRLLRKGKIFVCRFGERF